MAPTTSPSSATWPSISSARSRQRDPCASRSSGRDGNRGKNPGTLKGLTSLRNSRQVVRSLANTVDLSWSGGCFRGMTEGLAQAGDGRVEGLRFQVVLLAVDGAPQTAGAPRLNLPEGLVIGLRGLGLAGGGSRSAAGSTPWRHGLGRRDDDDVLVVAQALGRGGGPAFGRKV